MKVAVIHGGAAKFRREVSSKKDRLPYLHTRFMFFICKKLEKSYPDDMVD